jgi:hypothetical protein
MEAAPWQLPPIGRPGLKIRPVLRTLRFAQKPASAYKDVSQLKIWDNYFGSF